MAGKDEKCVDKALKLIKVEYQVLEPVMDFHTAKDNPVLVHPEDNWEALCLSLIHILEFFQFLCDTEILQFLCPHIRLPRPHR